MKVTRRKFLLGTALVPLAAAVVPTIIFQASYRSAIVTESRIVEADSGLTTFKYHYVSESGRVFSLADYGNMIQPWMIDG